MGCKNKKNKLQKKRQCVCLATDNRVCAACSMLMFMLVCEVCEKENHHSYKINVNDRSTWEIYRHSIAAGGGVNDVCMYGYVNVHACVCVLVRCTQVLSMFEPLRLGTFSATLNWMNFSFELQFWSYSDDSLIQYHSIFPIFSSNNPQMKLKPEIHLILPNFWEIQTDYLTYWVLKLLWHLVTPNWKYSKT